MPTTKRQRGRGAAAPPAPAARRAGGLSSPGRLERLLAAEADGAAAEPAAVSPDSPRASSPRAVATRAASPRAVRQARRSASAAGAPANATATSATAASAPSRAKPHAPARAVLREVLARQLAVVEANEAGLIAGTGPEPLHDLRVAVRRARSALGQLPGVLAARSAARLREELGWLGQLSGPCRDLDVLAETLAALLAASPAWVREELRPLLAALASERAAERRRLLAGLDSPRYRRLLGRWREVAAGPLRGPSPARAQLPAAELLGERAGKAARRLRRRARRLGEHPEPAPLHELRIAAKKLRYLLELFRELGDEAEIRRLGGRLRHLQEELGALNDDAVAARWLAAAVVRFGAEENAAAGGDAAAALRVGLAAGYLLGRLDGRRPSRLGALEPALADLLAIARRRRVARLFAGDASDAGRSG